jgi:hypothetical protein
MTQSVRLYLPSDSDATTIIDPSGELHTVLIDSAGARYIDQVDIDCARMILNSGDMSSLAWLAENGDLARTIGRPARPPGVNLAQHWANERDAMPSRSLAEITKQSLAMHRRALR